MAIADTISSMYENVGEVYDTITNVDLPTNKNIQNIPSTMRSSYLEIMNNGIDTIWNNWEKVEGTGETLTLNSTEEAPMKINLKGNTSQEGTPTPETPQDIHVVSGDNEIQVCGKNLFDKNSITLGYIDSNGNVVSAGVTNVSTSDFILIPSGATNLVRTTLKNSAFYDEDKVFISRIYSTSLPVPNNAKYIRLTVINTDLNNEQLEVGSTATTYEPYQSASYPINLPVENLFDKDNANYVNGWIDGTTMRLNTINGNRMFYIPCKPNTIYTISRSVITSSFRTITYNSTPFPTVTSSNVDYTVGSVLKNDNGTTLTITTNANAKYLVVHYGKIEDTNLNESLATIQVEYGSKQNSYTPYGTTPIELCKIGDYQDSIKKSTGKNLCNTTFELGGIDTTTGQNGSGTDRVRTKDYVEVKPNTTYTLSGVQGSRVVCFYNSSKAYLSYEVVGSQSTSGTFITPNDTSYIRWYIIQTNTNINEMLNEGTTALPYEPYGKVWYLNKQIGKVVFDGSETWTIVNSTATNRVHSTPSVVVNPNGELFSNYFTYNTNTWRLSDGNTGIYRIASSGNIIISDTIISDEAFKTWLSTHNTTAYYVLATPTYTEITDSTLISQLEALNGARSYNPQTNVNQVSNDNASILNASALSE